MSDDVLRQHQLFWIFIQSEGKCSVCGEEVMPEEAALTSDFPPIDSDVLGLDDMRLAHSRCQAGTVPWERTLRAA